MWSYFHTYGLPTLIARGSNNYGPFQYPEKLIPLMILNALHGDKLPVYGDGMQVRNWIYVEDFARAIGHVLEHGEPGNVYNAGGPDECANLEVVQRIIQLTGGDESLIEYVTDRPGHDRRYSLSSREGARARLGAADALRRRARPHGRLVPRQPVVVGADPLGRLPRVLRAPVRALARLRLAPRLLRRQSPSSLTSENVVEAFLSSPRRALTLAVAVLPVTVTSVTSRSKSSASPVSFSTSPAQSLPDVFSLFASAVESTSRQIADGLAVLGVGLQVLDRLRDGLVGALEVVGGGRRLPRSRRGRRRARAGAGGRTCAWGRPEGSPSTIG